MIYLQPTNLFIEKRVYYFPDRIEKGKYPWHMY